MEVGPEYDVEFANRPGPRRKKVVTAYIPEQRRSERISETIIRERSAEFVPAPRSSTPVIRPVTPPIVVSQPLRLELVSVEESRTSPRGSRVSVGGRRRARDEVIVERARERVIVAPPPPQFETYRYVPGMDGDEAGRRRSRSVTYETNPRHSGRVVERERERVVIDEGGRRREYYRRP